jgi:hypothetical protein
MSRLLRAFPAAWRARYGDEFEALLEEVPAGRRVALDVLALVLRLRLRQAAGSLLMTPGDPGMDDPFLRQGDPHARRLALVGLLLTLPTILFLGYVVATYGLGLAAPSDVIEVLVQGPLVEPITVLGPFLALAIAVWSVARVRMRWQGGALSAVVTVHARRLNLAVLAVAGLLSVVILVYGLIENF